MSPVPAGRARIIAIVVAVACLCAAAVRSAIEIRDAADVASPGLASSHDRELKPFRSLDIPAGAAEGAASLIPLDATYAVVVGTTLPLNSAQRIAVPDMLHYWLLPRRWLEDPQLVQWVIAYGSPTETIGVRFASQTEVAPGIVVAEVES